MKIILSVRASNQLSKLYAYLESEFSSKVRHDFQKKLDKNIRVIKLMPFAFPSSRIFKNCRKCVVSPQTSIYYVIQKEVIKIIAVLDNRRNKHE